MWWKLAFRIAAVTTALGVILLMCLTVAGSPTQASSPFSGVVQENTSTSERILTNGSVPGAKIEILRYAIMARGNVWDSVPVRDKAEQIDWPEVVLTAVLVVICATFAYLIIRRRLRNSTVQHAG